LAELADIAAKLTDMSVGGPGEHASGRRVPLT
jgi:hypothetical protein